MGACSAITLIYLALWVFISLLHTHTHSTAKQLHTLAHSFTFVNAFIFVVFSVSIFCNLALPRFVPLFPHPNPPSPA